MYKHEIVHLNTYTYLAEEQLSVPYYVLAISMKFKNNFLLCISRKISSHNFVYSLELVHCIVTLQLYEFSVKTLLLSPPCLTDVFCIC